MDDDSLLFWMKSGMKFIPVDETSYHTKFNHISSVPTLNRDNFPCQW